MRRKLVRRVVLKGLNIKTQEKEFIISNNIGIIEILKSYLRGTTKNVKLNIKEDDINNVIIYSKYVYYFLGYKKN